MPSFSDLYSVYVITHYSLIKHSHMTVDVAYLYNYGWGRPGGWAPLLDILMVHILVAKGWAGLVLT